MNLNRKTRQNLAAVAVSVFIATVASLCWPPERNLPLLDPFLQTIQVVEWKGYDALFNWRGPLIAKIDPRIAVVGYSYQTQGKGQLEAGESYDWPPPRRFHARVVDRLVKDGAKVVVFDVLMHSRSPYGPADDHSLDVSLAHAGNCVLASRVVRDDVQKSEQLDAPYYDDALGIDFERHATDAFVDIPSDSDKTIRRMQPLQKIQGAWLPSLAGAAFLKLTGADITLSTQTPTTIILGGRLPIPRTGPTVIDPANPENVSGTSYFNFPAGLSMFRAGVSAFTYEQVYRGEFPVGSFRGKAVFIGVAGTELAASQSDIFQTSYTSSNPEQVGGQVTTQIYGVYLQAQMLNAMLENMYIRQAARWQIWVIVFAFSCLATASVRSTLSWWRGPLMLVLTVGSYVALSYLLFAHEQFYLPWAIPSALLIGSAAGVAWFERGQMRKFWAGYVSPAYMEAMLRDGIEAKPERVEEATVIFGDIRGFTNFSGKHAPEKVVRLLDKHLEKLVHIVFAESGTVDKFLGDGILIVFGAPALRVKRRSASSTADHAVRAVRSACRMQAAASLPIFDDDGTEYSFATGFGITTGPLVAGHVGSRELASFTLIGDTVNLASRLQAVTGQPDVVIDTATLEKVRDHVTVVDLGPQNIKGKPDPIPCFKVTGWRE